MQLLKFLLGLVTDGFLYSLLMMIYSGLRFRLYTWKLHCIWWQILSSSVFGGRNLSRSFPFPLEFNLWKYIIPALDMWTWHFTRSHARLLFGCQGNARANTAKEGFRTRLNESWKCVCNYLDHSARRILATALPVAGKRLVDRCRNMISLLHITSLAYMDYMTAMWRYGP